MVYKLTFPSDFPIKNKTFTDFVIQSLFDVFMQDFFNIDVSLNMKFHTNSTQSER